ncbi:hypothetical protein D6C80_08101 [Aureobasidium pullulans]|nr:hypothetical protein D6C80_08101 [Aureobasidium pullulans]
MSDIQGLRAQIYDNYRAVDAKTKVHILVRRHLDGRYRACVAAKDSTRFPLLQDFGEMSLTVVDALKALLDRSCEWLYEAEARDAESELRRLERWVSETPDEHGQQPVITFMEEIERAITCSVHAAELERPRVKNLRRIANRQRARSPTTIPNYLAAYPEAHMGEPVVIATREAEGHWAGIAINNFAQRVLKTQRPASTATAALEYLLEMTEQLSANNQNPAISSKDPIDDSEIPLWTMTELKEQIIGEF